MTIGQNIRALRKKKGLTQAQLAERLNITDRAVPGATPCSTTVSWPSSRSSTAW